MQTVAVIGLGYIGLPTAAILAGHGLTVKGVDTNEERVQAVNAGQVPFVEADLGAHLSGAVAQGRLTAETKVPHADVYVIAVPTPLTPDRAADVSAVESAIDRISATLVGGELIIIESTSPPGTTVAMASRVAQRRPDLVVSGELQEVDFAYCPERVLPGRVMVELVTNPRTVGGLTVRASERAREFYSIFCQGEITMTNATTAEMVKLAENAYRDVNIAFANELSILAEHVNINVFELIDLANRHPRVNILQPGPGVGGHCIAVDPWFLISALPGSTDLMAAARRVNDNKPTFVVQQVLGAVGDQEAPLVAVLGLTFKPDVDDLRESPALTIADTLARQLPDARILATDPHVSELPPQLRARPNVRLVGLNDALESADVIVLLVDHREFRETTFSLQPTQRVVDTRGVWSEATIPKTSAAAGFEARLMVQ